MWNLSFALCLLALSGAAPARAQSHSTNVTTEPLLPSDAQSYLRTLIPQGKKWVTLDAYVVGTNVRSVDLGSSCFSSSSGSVKGEVDDNGDVSGTVESDGSSNCSQRHKYYNTLKLGLLAHGDSTSGYLVTAQCVVKWVWDHCGMPDQRTIYPVVLEETKKGTFNVYAATAQRLGGKNKAARFAVLSVDRVRLNGQTPGLPH